MLKIPFTLKRSVKKMTEKAFDTERAKEYFDECFGLKSDNIEECIISCYRMTDMCVPSEKLENWMENKKKLYTGAIGGRFEYTYSPIANKRFGLVVRDCHPQCNDEVVVYPAKGEYSFSVFSTSLGSVLKVIDNKTEEVVDLTRYDEW